MKGATENMSPSIQLCSSLCHSASRNTGMARHAAMGKLTWGNSLGATEYFYVIYKSPACITELLLYNSPTRMYKHTLHIAEMVPRNSPRTHLVNSSVLWQEGTRPEVL